ncbi:HGxxPAAW family protein [Kitasatospora sp. NPDC096147]|uniref:HGxxPAAW family protein n=1 Tax=Kitasatospora sp. NPDC096147 TaxID=3364093 RepID=UPI0038181E4F
MSGIHGHHDMGHTLAGWTGTAMVTAGTALTGTGMCTGTTPLLWAGGAVVLLGALATWVLHLTGWGKPSGPRPESQWPWRVRDTAPHPGCLGCRLAGMRHRNHPTPRTPATTSAPWNLKRTGGA